MTQEEKAKAYDEALTKAKIHINCKGIGDTVNLCTYLFPELTESEDERIIVRLIEYFQGFLEGYEDCYKDGGCVKWEGLDVKSILAYLEKQKEHQNNSDAPNKSSWSGMISSSGKDMNLDEIAQHYVDNVREYNSEPTWDLMQTAVCYGYYCCEQKENPKSADSIPSNCTSDAKCENRWHNIKDSLPDSTREVLCKDAIGNYFIGRYYSKGIWEVSMYDDCDKSNEDNPPVVMWIDIPSEKQKEQKPAEWSEEDEEMLEYVIGDVNDAKQLFATKEAIDLCDKEISWLKSLRPSWKPSEEQMKALQNAVALTACNKELTQLYEQLKKL